MMSRKGEMDKLESERQQSSESSRKHRLKTKRTEAQKVGLLQTQVATKTREPDR